MGFEENLQDKDDRGPVAWNRKCQVTELLSIVRSALQWSLLVVLSPESAEEAVSGASSMIMKLRSYIHAIHGKVLRSVFRRTVYLYGHGPIVSFSFDDFPRSAFTVGGDILKRYGGRGTYYVAMDLMNSTNALGEQFEQGDLHLLARDGHELASHTRSHLSSREVSFATFCDNVKKGREAIAEMTGLQDSGNFAYPYGDVTLEAKRKLDLGLASCRGTCGGINGPEIDLSLLRANSLYGDVRQLERAKTLIRQNQRIKGWLIFYTHDVTENPSAFGCTPALLESTVAYAAQTSRIMTITAVLAQVRVLTCGS